MQYLIITGNEMLAKNAQGQYLVSNGAGLVQPNNSLTVAAALGFGRPSRTRLFMTLSLDLNSANDLDVTFPVYVPEPLSVSTISVPSHIPSMQWTPVGSTYIKLATTQPRFQMLTPDPVTRIMNIHLIHTAGGDAGSEYELVIDFKQSLA